MDTSMSEPPTSAPRRNSYLIKAIIIVIAIIALVLGGLWWWHNRPIKPVKFSAKEEAVVEAKVAAIQGGEMVTNVENIPQPEPAEYQKGSKEVILTERELNGLLNKNTNLGKAVSFELARNAIHARVQTDLDPDIPIVGGKTLNARARFLVSDVPGKASFVIDDITVWGISLPNDWLGGLKGQDLIGEAIGGKRARISGIKEFKVEPGRLYIRLAD
jgi:hypothetical protein